MNTLNYKDFLNTNQKIELLKNSSESIDLAWNSFFLNDYQSYINSSISSSAKVFKSFTSNDVRGQTVYISTKSIYDEYFFDLHGKNYPSDLYTSSIQIASFDYITNVYFNPDIYDALIVFGNPRSNFDEFRLFDILYANYNGSGSTHGNIINYNNSTKAYDLSYPTKAVYHEIKQLSTATEIIKPEKILISGSTDNVFALNFSSNHIFDGIAKKSFELSLCKMNGSQSIDQLDRHLNVKLLGIRTDPFDPSNSRRAYSERDIFTFTELNTPYENLVSTANSNYIVSGSLTAGIYLENNLPIVYGKIYYNQGLVILDADKIGSLLNLSLDTGSNSASNNSLRLYKSIQAALKYFIIVTTGTSTSPVIPGIPYQIYAYAENQLTTPKLNIKQEINSVFYTCKLDDFEFNYSTNPTYYDETDGSMTIKKFYTGSSDFFIKPETYVTSIGLYDSTYNLLAIAKLSKVQRKSFNNSLIINVRLDY